MIIPGGISIDWLVALIGSAALIVSPMSADSRKLLKNSKTPISQRIAAIPFFRNTDFDQETVAEFVRLDDPRFPYPLYELTASGLNSAGAAEGAINQYRLSPNNVWLDHFGTIRINWERDPPGIQLELRGINGKLLQWKSFPLGSTNIAARTRNRATTFGKQGN